jgi:hypothetical protein
LWPKGDIIPAFARGLRKTKKASVRITGAAAEIQAKHFPNISLKRYSSTSLRGSPFVS